jgi:hypothetical protein
MSEVTLPAQEPAERTIDCPGCTPCDTCHNTRLIHRPMVTLGKEDYKILKEAYYQTREYRSRFELQQELPFWQSKKLGLTFVFGLLFATLALAETRNGYLIGAISWSAETFGEFGPLFLFIPVVLVSWYLTIAKPKSNALKLGEQKKQSAKAVYAQLLQGIDPSLTPNTVTFNADEKDPVYVYLHNTG